MKVERLCDMIAAAHHVFNLYYDKDGGVCGDFCSVGVSHSNTDEFKPVPQLLLMPVAFFEVAENLHADIDLKNNDPERPCFYYAGVQVITVITMEEAAARGYLVGGEIRKRSAAFTRPYCG